MIGRTVPCEKQMKPRGTAPALTSTTADWIGRLLVLSLDWTLTDADEPELLARKDTQFHKVLKAIAAKLNCRLVLAHVEIVM